MVKFLDLKATYTELKDNLDAAYTRVMESGWYILGQEVEAFEKEWATYCGVDHCVSVANGLDALHLTLRAMGIGPGDEVIVPSNTYIATWLAVSQVGAIPVPVEPDISTYNIDSKLIEAAITPNTKAIVPVHLYGQPANLTSIIEIGQHYNLKILSDAAQAHGAYCYGKPCGNLGDAAAWSFYPSKNLGAFGDGGAVTSNDFQLIEKIRLLRNYGSPKKYQNEVQGFNSRLDPLQAAFLRIKLGILDEWNGRRRKLAKLYNEGLKDLEDLFLPQVPEWADPNWHVYVIKVTDRDAFQRKLADKGIQTLIHYPIPPHRSGAYKNWLMNGKTLKFPRAEALAEAVISLPIGPHLNQENIETVISAIRDICKN